VELTVLGCGGTWPDPGGATSGYLLRADGFNLWIDAGSGTLARLTELIPISEIGAVVISHAHPDHFVDLYPTFYARHYADMGHQGLPLYCPTGFFGEIAGLVGEASRDQMRLAFDVREIRGGDAVEAGPFRIRAAEMSHIGVHALGYRIENGGASVAYTGDTGPNANLLALARGVDLMVSEATWQDHMDLLPFHMSASQAGEHAKSAGVARLVLTHIWPSLDKEVSREQADATFDGPIDVAFGGLRLELGG
jgi:ribonuclease BN (tRNA processing enzyme)